MAVSLPQTYPGLFNHWLGFFQVYSEQLVMSLLDVVIMPLTAKLPCLSIMEVNEWQHSQEGRASDKHFFMAQVIFPSL